jgi:hypothetical protein
MNRRSRLAFHEGPEVDRLRLVLAFSAAERIFVGAQRPPQSNDRKLLKYRRKCRMPTISNETPCNAGLIRK